VHKTESKPNAKPNTYPNAKHYVNPKRENTADRNLRRPYIPRNNVNQPPVVQRTEFQCGYRKTVAGMNFNEDVIIIIIIFITSQLERYNNDKLPRRTAVHIYK